MIRIKPITVRERRRSTGVFYYHCLLPIILYCYYVILLLLSIVRQQCGGCGCGCGCRDGVQRPKTGNDDDGATHVIADWSAMGHVIWRDVVSAARMCVCLCVRVPTAAEYDDGNYSDVVCAYVYKTRVTGGGDSYEKTYLHGLTLFYNNLNEYSRCCKF